MRFGATVNLTLLKADSSRERNCGKGEWKEKKALSGSIWLQ